jgi:hypothetical protein
MVDGSATVCTVKTAFGDFTDCTVSDTSRQITVRNVFANNVGYKDEITIIVEKVKNPATNKPGNGFVI